jgi:hypothetical protein
MDQQSGRDGIRDAVDPITQERARAEQDAEQEQLDAETRNLRGDPGDPKDRLSEGEHERLMTQTQYRELHP